MTTMNSTSELLPLRPAPLAPPARMNGKPAFTVPAKTILNLESGFRHKLLCDGPTFSTGDACAYSCAFCYVPDMFRKLARVDGLARTHGLRHEDMVIRRADPIATLRRQLTLADGSPRFTDPADTRVVYASPAVDVAANPELCAETVQACAAILELTHWQIRLLSKSNLLPQIAQALDARHSSLDPRSRVIYGVSTGTLDDKLAAAFEARTPLVRKRLDSLYWLQDHGFRTYGMICPSLPLATAVVGSLKAVSDQETYAQFAAEMAHAIRAERCEHVWAEVINVRGESMTRTVAALHAAGFRQPAAELQRVSTDRVAWENYARATFEAHAEIYRDQRGPDGMPKLRFLQYISAASKPWWSAQQSRGSILL